MTIGLLSELLRKNDDHFTWLSLTNNEIGIPMVEFTQALRHNVTLRKVSCHAGFLASLQDPDDLVLLMTALGQLPHLQDLWVALPPKQAHWSARLLKRIFNMSDDDEDEEEEGTEEQEEQQPSQTTKTTPMASTSRLSKLTIRGVDDEGCFVLAQALSNTNNNSSSSTANVNMTDLQVRGTTASTTSQLLGTLVGRRQSQVTKAGVLALAQMLQTNKRLERLDLSYKGVEDDESLLAIAEALEVNPTLQKLELNTLGNKGNNATAQNNNNNNNNNNRETPTATATATGKGYQALVETMRTNYRIQYLSTPVEGGDTKYMMELLAKLNRTGARALMRNTTEHTALEDVLEMMLQKGYSNDITALYELLRLNPALWDPVKAKYAIGLKQMMNMNRNRNSPAVRKPVTSASTGPAATGFIKPPSDQAGSACASTVAQVANRTSSAFQNHHRSSSSLTTDTYTTSQMVKNSAATSSSKPVMARWNENIFTQLEEEKRQNYKRWTPTIIEKVQQQQQDQVVPAAEWTSASEEEEESGSDSDDAQHSDAAAANQKNAALQRRPWKKRSTAIISYDVPAVVAATATAAPTTKPVTGTKAEQEEEEEITDATMGVKTNNDTAAAASCSVQSESGSKSSSAVVVDQKPEAKMKNKRKSSNTRRQRRGPIEISYDVPAVVAAASFTSSYPTTSSKVPLFLRRSVKTTTSNSRANNVAPMSGLTCSDNFAAAPSSSSNDVKHDEDTHNKNCSSSNQTLKRDGSWNRGLHFAEEDEKPADADVSLPSIRIDDGELFVDLPSSPNSTDHSRNASSCPPSPLSPPAVYDALATGVALLGSAMLRSFAIGRRKSW